MAELTEQWQASGRTADATAKRERVPVSRLWYSTLRTGRAASAPTAVVPVRIRQDETREMAPAFVLTLSPPARVSLAMGSTDMRRTVDGLHALVLRHETDDSYSEHLFVFRNRRGDRLMTFV